MVTTSGCASHTNPAPNTVGAYTCAITQTKMCQMHSLFSTIYYLRQYIEGECVLAEEQDPLVIGPAPSQQAI